MVRTQEMETAEQLCRSTDPATSHESAVVLVETGSHAFMLSLALRVLRENPGSTSRELDSYAGRGGDGAIRKRLRELERRGLAYTNGTRRCRFSGRNVQVWWPVTQQVQIPLF